MNRFLSLCFLWLLGVLAQAQDPVIPGGVFTAGTTATDERGRPWAYLEVSAPDPAVLDGRVLAVYLKTAAADAPGEFKLQGTLQPAVNKALAAAYLDRGVLLGGNRAQIESSFRALYRQVTYPNYLAGLRAPAQPGDPPWPSDPPQAGEPPSAEQIAIVVARAAQDADLKETLLLASAGSPAFAMAAGHAWGGPLPVAAGQPVTLELRLREGAKDTGVVGRVAMVAGEPLPLPPPGPPIQVPDASPSGDLSIGLRWATPVDLRRFALLSSGYNLYRVDRQIADSTDIDSTEELLTLIEAEPARVRRLNRGVLIPPELFTEADVDPLTGPDRETKFYTDDNGRYERDATGNVTGAPFADCAEYAYFVTARDLLGRDGLLSPRGDGRVVRRMAPQVPTGLEVKTEILPATPTTLERGQVEVRWTPSAVTGTPVTRYEILRGTSGASPAAGPHFDAALKLNRGANLEKDNPALFIPCGEVSASAALVDGAHVWVDTAPVNAPAYAQDGKPLPRETIWYAVRAVYQSSCNTVYSSPGPPAFAAFRPVKSPAAPAAQLCAQGYNPPMAAVVLESIGEDFQSHPPGENRIRTTCRRANAGVTYATFQIFFPTPTVGTVPAFIEQRTVYFPRETGEGNDEISTDFIYNTQGLELSGIPGLPGQFPIPSTKVFILCFIGTDAGATTGIGFIQTDFLPDPGAGATERSNCRRVSFLGGAFSLGSPPATNPLRQAFLKTAHSSSNLTPSASGFVLAGVPDLPNGTPVFLQAASGGPLVDVGGAMVIDGKVLLPPINGGPATVFTAWTLQSPPSASSEYLHVRGKGDGGTEPVRLGMCAPSEAAEYRFYRQVDMGETRLLAAGEAPPGGGQVFCEDSGLPTTSAKLQYFGQFVDRSGNASPLVPLGARAFTLIVPSPVPTLQEPRAVTTSEGYPGVRLDWFCPPPGVERFEVFMEQKGAALQRGQLIGGLFGSPYLTKEDPTSLLRPNPGAAPSVFTLSSGQVRGSAESSPSQNSFHTGRVGGDLGEGPEFHVVTRVERSVTYRIWIRAIGPTGGVSPPSKAWDFTWHTPKVQPPAGAEPTVDWPARPIPEAFTGASFTPAVTVNQQTFWNYDFYRTISGNTFIWPQAPRAQMQATDPPPVTLYQRGVTIGSIDVTNENSPAMSSPLEYDRLTETRTDRNYRPELFGIGSLRGRVDFNLHLARKNGAPGETILPAALYRRQVPSNLFPDTTGDVIQVSPLVRRIAWTRDSGREASILKDPFIGVEAVGTRDVEWRRDYDAGANPNRYYRVRYYVSTFSLSRLQLYLLDTQPVIEGAAYEYFLVRFDSATGEIKETINAGTTYIGDLPDPPVMPPWPGEFRPNDPK